MFNRFFIGRAIPVFNGGCRGAMPLRATIQGGRMSSTATESTIIKELPGDEKEDVLFNSIYGLRTIELNRPRKLHSLNGSMIRKIVPRLQEWKKSDMANVIVIKGSGDKAFCAGGDVAVLAQQNSEGAQGQQNSTDYFALEYKLDHYIATYDKPFVAFMDGITMGGGVGLSVHAPFRIATERTVFAMPETTIGFFPDVGGSFFLPRLNGAIGTYLALTSDRLKGVDVFYTGIATHYLHSTSLSSLETRLAELQFRDYDSLDSRLNLVNSTIEEFVTGLPHDQPIRLSGSVREAIDRCFGLDSVSAILDALKKEGEETKEWADSTLQTLYERSPTSVHVSLKQMRLGQNWGIRETFQREHQMAGKFMKHPDFTEGVTALLVRKPTSGEPRIPPKWQPATLDDIKPKDKIADPFFELSGGQRLALLNDVDYSQYPHAKFSLPTERDVEIFVRKNREMPGQVADYFAESRQGKQGVKEVVREIISRKTRIDEGKLVWVD